MNTSWWGKFHYLRRLGFVVPRFWIPRCGCFITTDICLIHVDWWFDDSSAAKHTQNCLWMSDGFNWRQEYVCLQDLPLTSYTEMLFPIDPIIFIFNQIVIHILRCRNVHSVIYPHLVVKQIFNGWHLFADCGWFPIWICLKIRYERVPLIKSTDKSSAPTKEMYNKLLFFFFPA